MAVRIKNLICRVNVRKGTPSTTLHQEERPARPAMAFAGPFPEPPAESGPAPSQTATQSVAENGRRSKRRPAKADARAVADRVYSLMKEEARLTKLRGKPW